MIPTFRRTVPFALAMAAAALFAHLLTPTRSMREPGEIVLESMIPERFGDWTYIPSALAQVDLSVRRDEKDLSAQIYDQILMRSYRHADGTVVQLALAWGRQQRQEVKIHRPELCYTAQGFKVGATRPVDPMGASGLDGRTLIASAPRRLEPVVYWIRIGDTVSNDAVATRLYLLREGLAGRIPDGILVRASQVVDSEQRIDASIARQQGFLKELVAALPPASRDLLVPTTRAGG